MYLWVNPKLTGKPSLKDAAAIWEVDDLPVGKRLRFNLSGTELGQYLIDEVRVGSSWEEVIGRTPLAKKLFQK